MEATELLEAPSGRFSQLDAGHKHTCAIRQDGAVECWGRFLREDDDRDPELKAAMEALVAPPEGRFKSLSAGFLFSCGVRIDNSAECWGLAAAASQGGLGPPDGEYTAVAAGGYHACGIRLDQTVVCWGSDHGFNGQFFGQATPPDGPFEVISAGFEHTCGFRPNGEIRCWGSIVGPPAGEITEACMLQPDGTPYCYLSEAGAITQCETNPDGTTRCWVDEEETKAKRIWGGWAGDPPDGDRKAMDSAKGFSCALWDVGYTDGGYIKCWGSNVINGLRPEGSFVAVTASADHGCGLKPDGAIECWGDNDFGQASPP